MPRRHLRPQPAPPSTSAACTAASCVGNKQVSVHPWRENPEWHAVCRCMCWTAHTTCDVTARRQRRHKANALFCKNPRAWELPLVHLCTTATWPTRQRPWILRSREARFARLLPCCTAARHKSKHHAENPDQHPVCRRRRGMSQLRDLIIFSSTPVSHAALYNEVPSQAVQ